MLYNNILPVLTLLGIGAIIPEFLKFISDKRKIRDQGQYETKKKRYECIILLMYSMLDFDSEKINLQKHGRDFRDIEELKKELLVELTNMMLFASDKVILSLKLFLKSPSEDAYLTTTLAMRKDLYNIKTKLAVNDLKMTL